MSTRPPRADEARWRLFVALPVPAATATALNAALASYRRAFTTPRWLDPATFHLTLAFLGHVPAGTVPAIRSACDEVGRRWPAFEVSVAGGGGRAREGEGVAWLWLRVGARGVIELAEDVEWALVRVGLPGGTIRRAPSAHVTVARRADASLIAALRGETDGPLRAEWTADRLHLMRSHLGRTGARYELVHEAILGASLRP